MREFRVGDIVRHKFIQLLPRVVGRIDMREWVSREGVIIEIDISKQSFVVYYLDDIYPPIQMLRRAGLEYIRSGSEIREELLCHPVEKVRRAGVECTEGTGVYRG